MAHTDFEADLVCEGLQLCLPQPISAAIATAAISSNQYSDFPHPKCVKTPVSTGK